MAVRFDADGEDYVSTSAPPGNVSTTLCWFKISVDRNTFSTIWASDANNTSAYMILQTGSDGTTLLFSQSGVDITGPALTVGTWYRVAVVRSSATAVTVYVGAAGAALSSHSSSSFTSFTPSHFRIGESSFTAEWLNGCVASLKQYDVALTQAECENELLQYTPVRTTNLVRWHPFVNPETVDYSGNARTLTGGTGTAREDGPPLIWDSRARSLVTLPNSGLIISPSSIGSAEAFGTHKVNHTLYTTGIASAEVFDSPTLHQTIYGSGIASAGAFGSHQIVLGGSTIIPDPIPSQQAFGSPSVYNYGLVGTGIPSQNVMGSPSVYLPIDNPPSIESAEVFSNPSLDLVIFPIGIISGEIFGSTAAEVPPIVKRQIPQRLITTYEIVCVARIPSSSGKPSFMEIDPIDWTSLNYSEELSTPTTLSASCKIPNLTEPVLQRLRNLDEHPTEIWMYRNGKISFAGPLLGYSVNNEEVSLECRDILSYLDAMFVTSNLVYANVDQFTIVKGLIDHWQNLEYGHFGIDTSSIGVSGVTRDITFLAKELHNIGKKIEDLSRGSNGFDIDIDPLTRKVNLYYPQQGIDRSEGEDAIVFDSRNVTSSNVTCSATFGDLASESIGTANNSGGETLISVQSNPELRARYGRIGTAQTFEAADQSTLDSQTKGALDVRANVLLIPGPNTRITDDADLSQYGKGDTVSYQVHSQLAVQGKFRLRKRNVSVSNTGTESVSMQFA